MSPDTLRHYERLGVLPAAHRSSGGYRLYSEASVSRVLFVRSALRFGFSLKQLTTFINARDAGRPPCRQVRTTAGQILTEMDRQIEGLIAARADVRATLLEWDQRLARTPAGASARLLDALPSHPDSLKRASDRDRIPGHRGRAMWLRRSTQGPGAKT